jgi:hypothetical protein
VRCQEIIKIGRESNETVRTFSKQVMAKAEKNFGKIQSLIKSTSTKD